jgi:hypothetical protein
VPRRLVEAVHQPKEPTMIALGIIAASVAQDRVAKQFAPRRARQR